MSRYGQTGGKDIATDAKRLRPLLAALGGADTYKVKVSADDTTPNYLEEKVASADSSVVITVTDPGADEGLDFSVSVYVAAQIASHAADVDAHHPPVTLGAGSNAILTLSGQELTLGDVATQAELDAHAGNANAHHNQSHVLATASALGPDHTVSGLTSGQVLKATSATAARFMQLLHSELGSVGANDHHNQSHVLATTSGLGADHTVSGLTARQVLIATGAATALFRALEDADIPASLVRTSVSITAGAGLTGGGDFSANRTINVAAADTSMTINADSIQVRLATTSGLQISTGLMLADTVAGAGLTIASKVLAVGAGDGIDVAADSVAVDVTDIIGTGLTEEATNNIAVDFSVVAAQTDLHNRSHSITSASDHTVSGAALDVVGLTATNTLGILTPSAAVSTAVSALLKSDGNGRLQVQGLGIGMAPTGNALYLASDITLSGDRNIIDGDLSIRFSDTFDTISVDAATVNFRRWDATRYYFSIVPTSTQVTLRSYDSTGAVNKAIEYVASGHTFSGGNVIVSNSAAIGGDLTIVTNGDQGDRFLMVNSNVSGGSVFYDFNQTDRDGGSTGALEMGFYRDANNITEIRLSKETFEVVVRDGGTYTFPLTVDGTRVIMEELVSKTSDPGNTGELYHTLGTVKVSL